MHQAIAAVLPTAGSALLAVVRGMRGAIHVAFTATGRRSTLKALTRAYQNLVEDVQ